MCLCLIFHNKLTYVIQACKVQAVGEGTGLGMAISFGIIDEHGGHIEVESELDKGTRITVRIPLSPDKRSYKTAMEPQG